MKNMPLSDELATARAERRKDVTRRLIGAPKCARVHGREPLPDRHRFDKGTGCLRFWYGGGDLGKGDRDAVCARVYPRYLPGDIVYHGETLVAVFSDVHPGGLAHYRRDDRVVALSVESGPVRWCWQRQILPSRFCPLKCARLFSRVVGVRAERLHEITEEDAKREGMRRSIGGMWCGAPHRVHGAPKQWNTAVYAFTDIWQHLNGKRAPAASNPWIWRYELSEPLSRAEALRLEAARKAAA